MSGKAWPGALLPVQAAARPGEGGAQLSTWLAAPLVLASAPEAAVSLTGSVCPCGVTAPSLTLIPECEPGAPGSLGDGGGGRAQSPGLCW